MPYYHDSRGKLNLLPPIRRNNIFTTTQQTIQSDVIRLPHVYVESTKNMLMNINCIET